MLTLALMRQKTQAAVHFEIEKGPPLWLEGSATNLPGATTKGLCE
jgi:hypothetical protein